MLAIVRRGGATHEKPPEVVRRQASRLPWAWDGLCFAVPLNDSTRDAARDLAWGAAPTTVSGLVWRRDNRGNVAAYLDSNAYMFYPDNPAHTQPSTAVTIYVRLRRVGAADFPGGGVLVKVHTEFSAPQVSWGIYNSDSFDNCMMGHLTLGGTPYYWENGSYPFPTTVWVSAVLRWQTGAEPRIDILGERGESLASYGYGSALSGAISYVSGQPLRFNSTDSPGVNFNAEYSQALVWSRRLTDTELQALVADPYGWYSPRRETIGLSSPYPLAFGGGEMRQGAMIGGLP